MPVLSLAAFVDSIRNRDSYPKSRPFLGTRLAALIVLSIAAPWVSAAAQDQGNKPTLGYASDGPFVEPWPKVVTLQGFIALKRFYGPPNHGEHPKTDRKISNWLLILPEPINVRFAAVNDKSKEHVITGVSRITLHATTDVLAKFLKQHLGQEIEVTGTLDEAGTSWYWARLSLDVQKASLLPRSRERKDRNLGFWDFE